MSLGNSHFVFDDSDDWLIDPSRSSMTTCALTLAGRHCYLIDNRQ
ncbi:hypothetical protein PN499_23210 [Kamptonema animale CS-326]|nr:hypothetical protein [Kamptonema animale CS-326]